MISSFLLGRRRVFLLGFAAMLPLAAPAAGQVVQGDVLDQDGRSIPRVIVELWVDRQAGGWAETDEQGRFRIARPVSSEGAFLSFRRLGYGTRTLPLTAGDSILRVQLEAVPVALAPVTVSASPARLCPNRENSQARLLWERMRSRYWSEDSDSVFAFGFMEVRRFTGRREDFDPANIVASRGWSSGPLTVPWAQTMPLSGYASPAAGGVGERTAFWRYRALDLGRMQDFAGAYFGQAHTLSLLRTGTDEMVISFCPRGRLESVGQIEGVLILTADTTLSAARWRFLTPRPHEDAGGEASYYPPTPAIGRALLAHQTVFWRKTTFDRYYFEAHTFVDWRRWWPEETP